MKSRLATASPCFSKPILGSTLAAIAILSVANAQQPAGGGHRHRSSHAPAIPTPFPDLAKFVKFPISRLSKRNFIEMGAIRSVISKGFVPQMKQDQQVVLLNYGYKKGGIIRLFETPAVAGVNPEEFTRQINESGIFHNVAQGDWQVKSVPHVGVFVVPASASKEALALAIQELSGR